MFSLFNLGSYDYDINCIFDGHEVNPPSKMNKLRFILCHLCLDVGPHLFSNDDDLPVTLNSSKFKIRLIY